MLTLKYSDDIYRIKGLIKSENGQVIQIDYSGSGWNIKEHNNPDAQCHLDFIYNREKEDQIRLAILKIR